MPNKPPAWIGDLPKDGPVNGAAIQAKRTKHMANHGIASITRAPPFGPTRPAPSPWRDPILDGQGLASFWTALGVHDRARMRATLGATDGFVAVEGAQDQAAIEPAGLLVGGLAGNVTLARPPLAPGPLVPPRVSRGLRHGIGTQVGTGLP